MSGIPGHCSSEFNPLNEQRAVLSIERRQRQKGLIYAFDNASSALRVIYADFCARLRGQDDQDLSALLLPRPEAQPTAHVPSPPKFNEVRLLEA